jgi:hypothetical protein
LNIKNLFIEKTMPQVKTQDKNEPPNVDNGTKAVSIE